MGTWLVTEASNAGEVPSIYIERFPELRHSDATGFVYR